MAAYLTFLRTAKYNQLVRIEEEPGSQARYAGRQDLGLRR